MSPDSRKGMTLRQMERVRFYDALEEWRKALVSKDMDAILITSCKVHAARRNKVDGRQINRVWREVHHA